MPLTTWRRLAALALLLAAAALAVAGCDRRASDPARPSTGSAAPGITQGIAQGSTPGMTSGVTPGVTPILSPGIAPDITPGTTSGTTSGTTPGSTSDTPPSTTTGSGIRVLDSLRPALPGALAAPVRRPPP